VSRMTYGNRTEVVGLFRSAQDLQAAVDDLETQGFNRADLSVMASESAIEEQFKGAYVRAKDLEDRTDTPTMAFISRESMGAPEGAVLGAFMYIPAVIGLTSVVASGGSLAAAIAATAISTGAGGAVGAFLARLIDQRYVHQIEEHLSRGGLLLWVAARDEHHVQRAIAIMHGHNAEDAHAHTLPVLSG
jgi:hypothetical protein